MRINDLMSKFKQYSLGLYYFSRFDNNARRMITGKISVNKKYGKIITDRCRIWKGVKLSVCGKDKNNKAILKIGRFTTIGDRTEIHVGKKVVIGESVRIAWDCIIMDRNYHGIDGKPEKINPVIIKDFTWIGCRSIIMPGVTVGRGAIIAAGSVVINNINDGEIWGGNPAKIIGTVEKIGMIN